MKTYPYTENGEIIELVRKSEHDAIVAELNDANDKVRSRCSEWVEIAGRHGAELDKIRSNNAETSKWRALAEGLATVLEDCKNTAMDKSIETHADDHAKGCVDEIWGWAEQALAAYESAKEGEQP